jgi:hypothetical protein
MAYELKERSYTLRDGEGVDDICNRLIQLSSSPYPIETITVTKTAMKVSTWEPASEEPPYGGFTFDSPTSISHLLQSIELQEISPTETGINAKAMAAVAKMMLDARAAGMAGVGWVVSDLTEFAKWIGIKGIPIRFLDLPLLQSEELPHHRLVLLCGKSSKNDPMTASRGVITSMEVDNAKV